MVQTVYVLVVVGDGGGEFGQFVIIGVEVLGGVGLVGEECSVVGGLVFGLSFFKGYVFYGGWVYWMIYFGCFG